LNRDIGRLEQNGITININLCWIRRRIKPHTHYSLFCN